MVMMLMSRSSEKSDGVDTVQYDNDKNLTCAKKPMGSAASSITRNRK